MKTKSKPKIGYFDNFDATNHIHLYAKKLVDINIITTKNLTPDFIDFAITNKNRIFLHIIINGMGATIIEPHIPTVKYMFDNISKLIKLGFPKNQILIIVKPIIPNDNGLKALQFLLRLFTEFKQLRLRYVRFEILKYYKNSDNQYSIANRYIYSRVKQHKMEDLFKSDQIFYYKYKILLEKYKNIITIDNETEPLIGTRELKPFGYINKWKNQFGVDEPIIFYKKNNKKYPIVDVLLSNHQQCRNRCIICPFK